jgi:hypothetical protein
VLNSKQLWNGLPKRRRRTALRASAELRSTGRSRLPQKLRQLGDIRCYPRASSFVNNLAADRLAGFGYRDLNGET